MCVGENYAQVCILAKWAKVQIYYPSLGRLEYRNSFSMPLFSAYASILHTFAIILAATCRSGAAV